MKARFRMVLMTSKHLPHALVRFARSPQGEGLILIGPEALVSVCPTVHALSLIHEPAKSMRDHSRILPSVKSLEILQRQEQGDQQRLQHGSHAPADKSRETLKQEQRKQQQQRTQAIVALQFKMRRKGLVCRSTHATCFSSGVGPRQASQPCGSLWGVRAFC